MKDAKSRGTEGFNKGHHKMSNGIKDSVSKAGGRTLAKVVYQAEAAPLTKILPYSAVEQFVRSSLPPFPAPSPWVFGFPFLSQNGENLRRRCFSLAWLNERSTSEGSQSMQTKRTLIFIAASLPWNSRPSLSHRVFVVNHRDAVTVACAFPQP